MNDLFSLTIEVGLTAGISAGVVALLIPRLHRAFRTLCGAAEVVEFWVMCTVLLFLLFPLLLVLFTTATDVHLQSAHLVHMREILFRIVMGLTLCLLGVGLAMWMMTIDNQRKEIKESGHE
jgi:hypothetical protein